MFGAPANTSPFGAPAPTAPFGAPATPFGAPAPAFGAPAAPTTTFGAPAFGAPAPTAFGAPAPTAAFGAPAPTAAFGAPSVFGAPPASGGFGAPSSAFGAPAPGLFGAPAPAGGGFGAAPAPTGFGMKPAGGGLFGAAPTPAPGTSIFGAPAPATTGLFGAPAPAPTGALFGQAPAAPAFGSPAPTFGAPSKQDGSTSIVLQSITAMSQYENKSFEELRVEDYMAGNKGQQQQPQQTPAGGFGGFGAAAQPAPATGLFGAPAPAPTGGGLFGSPAPVTGGLFGSAPATAPPTGGFGGFGTTPAPAFGAPAPATGLFGAPAAAPKPGGLFGSPAPAPAFGGFGSTAPAPAFGAPQPAPATGLFGAPAAAPKPGGLFGAPAPAPTGGLFGAAPAPAAGSLFGSPAPAPNSLFGAPGPAPSTGGLFGAPAAPAPAFGGSLFGAPAAPTTPAASGGLFGSAPTPAPAAGGLFGAPAPATTSFFGTPSAAPVGGLFGSPPAAMPHPAPAVQAAPTPSADVLLAQQLAAVEHQKKQLELTEAWRGNPPSGSKVFASSLYDENDRSWNSYAAQSTALMSYRAAPRSAAKIRPRGFTPTKQSPVSLALDNGGFRNGRSPNLTPNRFIGSATKALIIKPGSLTPKPKTRLLLTNGIASGGKESYSAPLGNGHFESPKALQFGAQDVKTPSPTMNSVSPRAGSSSINGDASPAHDFYREVVGSPDVSAVGQACSSPATEAKRHAPTLTKPGYIVYPPLQDLEVMSEADLAAVSDFKVERPGYGSVEWDGAVDVRGVDLDSTVVIESKNVSVYDDAELNGNKPKQGSKLNRPAVITMYGVFPKSGAESSSEAKDKLAKKIEKSTKKMGAELISFNADTGIWMFRVGHFSRYGLDDDDSDDDSEDANATPSLATLDEDEKNELGGASKFLAPTNEDESTSGSVFTDDLSAPEQMLQEVEEEEMEILRNGDDAYAIMTEELVEYEDALELQPPDHECTQETLFFPHEGEGEDSVECIDTPHLPSVVINSASLDMGICNQIARKCGLAQPSNVDYGFRMRHSFRVGWRPDGSFLHLKPSDHGGHILAQSKPFFSSDKSNAVELLQTHRNHSVTVEGTQDDVPLFTLPRGLHSSGNESSHDALCAAVNDYVQLSSSCSLDSAHQKAVSSSFSLMTCLYGDDETALGKISTSRRLEAVSNWLKCVVSDDVSEAIASAKTRGDIYGSVFAALSGGDLSRASSLAFDNDHLSLSLMLANSAASSQSLFESQLEMWNENKAQGTVPGGILRIFALARGTLHTEESIYKADSNSYTIDWRRRFGMYLWSCSHQEEATISSLVEKYTSDVSLGVAPPPIPFYADKMNDLSKAHSCILYQILEHYSNERTQTLANIASPPSHSRFRHDFTASFHLAASMSALTGSSLSRNQEDLIIDAISSQLIMSGSWEWAVYTTLSIIGNHIVPKSVVASRKMRARNIISRLYSPSNDSSALLRRSFLESLGVPSEWFSMAIAYRSANEGAILTYVEHLMHFSSSESLSAMENIVIPHYILGGKKSRDQLTHILHAVITTSDDFRDCFDASRLCRSIYEFLRLSDDVEELCAIPFEDLEMRHDEIEGMIDTATYLKSTLSDHLDSYEEQPP
eukprot:CCRYP_000914-RB/>CCRYP_000914-RB protein AED:0.16 eAED:0.16 QI:283/0.93/0.94/1/0.87/0.82/17/2644/1620